MRFNWNRLRPNFHAILRHTPWAWLFGFGFAIFLVIYFSSRDQIFTLTATSEIVRFKVSGAMSLVSKDPASIRLYEIQVAIQSKNANLAAKPCNYFDSLQLPNDTEILAIRKGQGVLKLQIDKTGRDNTPILVPKSSDDRNDKDIILEVGDTLTLSGCSESVDETFSDASIVLSFEGKLAVGTEPKNRMPGLLLSGSIQVIEKPPIALFDHDGRIVVQETPLTRGDMIEWPCLPITPKCNDKMPIVLYVGKDDAIGVTAHFANPSSNKVHVSRPGSDGYNVSVSLWRRLLADPLFNSLLIIAGIFQGLVACNDIIAKLRPRRRGP